MKNLSKREKQVLIELLKDGRISDQDIARKIKTSRPTVWRIRKRLEKRKLIRGYTTKTDFEKLGIKIHAVILYRWKDYSKEKSLEENIKFVNSLPEVILFIKGEGLGSKTDLIVSGHESLEDYESFIRKLKKQWRDNVENVEVFLSSVSGISKGYDVSSIIIGKLRE